MIDVKTQGFIGVTEDVKKYFSIRKEFPVILTYSEVEILIEHRTLLEGEEQESINFVNECLDVLHNTTVTRGSKTKYIGDLRGYLLFEIVRKGGFGFVGTLLESNRKAGLGTSNSKYFIITFSNLEHKKLIFGSGFYDEVKCLFEGLLEYEKNNDIVGKTRINYDRRTKIEQKYSDFEKDIDLLFSTPQVDLSKVNEVYTILNKRTDFIEKQMSQYISSFLSLQDKKKIEFDSGFASFTDKLDRRKPKNFLGKVKEFLTYRSSDYEKLDDGSIRQSVNLRVSNMKRKLGYYNEQSQLILKQLQDFLTDYQEWVKKSEYLASKLLESKEGQETVVKKVIKSLLASRLVYTQRELSVNTISQKYETLYQTYKTNLEKVYLVANN